MVNFKTSNLLTKKTSITRCISPPEFTNSNLVVSAIGFKRSVIKPVMEDLN